MTTIASRVGTEVVEVGPLVERKRWGTLAMKLLTTTDHKVIGNMYFVTSLAYFAFAGLLALAIRAELAFPGLQFMHYETYNQFFTMHGTLMLLMFATPMFVAFANAIMPLQIGAPDVAFPRMNAFSYWLYLFGSLTALRRLPHPRRGCELRLVRLRAAVGRGELARHRR